MKSVFGLSFLSQSVLNYCYIVISHIYGQVGSLCHLVRVYHAYKNSSQTGSFQTNSGMRLRGICLSDSLYSDNAEAVCSLQ